MDSVLAKCETCTNFDIAHLDYFYNVANLTVTGFKLCWFSHRSHYVWSSGVIESSGGVDVRFAHPLPRCTFRSFIMGLVNMQELLSRLVPPVATQPKICSGSHKGPSGRRW